MKINFISIQFKVSILLQKKEKYPIWYIWKVHSSQKDDNLGTSQSKVSFKISRLVIHCLYFDEVICHTSKFSPFLYKILNFTLCLLASTNLCIYVFLIRVHVIIPVKILVLEVYSINRVPKNCNSYPDEIFKWHHLNQNIALQLLKNFISLEFLSKLKIL